MMDIEDGAPSTGAATLSRKDFESDQEVRWCPGCGDYAILAAFLKTLPTLGIPREKHAIVSGIGCAARFPYYVNTYGFHTIHGRAPTFAAGLKSVNPDLTVWVITGDGDGLSIGGNHMLHALRRNLDINVLLFNNRIYGLTKGQYSPTSEQGKVTKSTPMGSIEAPINPIRFAISSEATFVARTLDGDMGHMSEIIQKAAQHKGVAFVEILQNCVIFNDGAWRPVAEKRVRADKTVTLEHGKPLIFGKERNMGIRLSGLKPEIVEFDPASPPSNLLVHDEHAPHAALSFLLAELEAPEMPIPIGVFRDIERPTYEQGLHAQVERAKKAQGPANLKSLVYGSNTWEINAKGESSKQEGLTV